MRRFSSLALLAAVSLGATVMVAAPAQAAPQSLYGTTVSVTSTSSSDSLLGSTAYVPVSGASLAVQLAASLAFDVNVSLRQGATELTTCTITTASTTCGMLTGGLFAAGATPVTVRFTGGPSTVDYTGTIFAVTNTAQTITVEWQDAAGTWVDGSGTSVPLRGATAARCVITNNSNAPITFTSMQGQLFFTPSGSTVTPINGTLAAGATGQYTIWSGSVASVGSVSCSGGVALRDGTGTGNGNGGGIIAIGGTIDVNRTPAPGTTVTITAAGILPPLVTEYAVLLDGVPVSGSPVAAPAPGFGFVLDVVIPSNLTPGNHVITVVSSFNGIDTAIAAFPFTVAGPQLAATGVATDVAPALGGALLLLAAGALLVGLRRRVTTR